MSEPRKYDVIRLGREGQPLVIIDDFAKDPDTLIATASESRFGSGGAFYPGIRAPAPFAYLNDRIDLIKAIFSDVFACPGGIDITESNFSLVTKPEVDLTPIQSLPHFDGFDTGRFAILHYLCGPEKGGTAFYRHIPTGYETVTEDRFETFKMALEAGVRSTGVIPHGFFRGDHPQYECLHRVQARFNRLVIYRGITLHSGDIPVGFKPDHNPATGRLTVNIFCESRKR